MCVHTHVRFLCGVSSGQGSCYISRRLAVSGHLAMAFPADALARTTVVGGLHVACCEPAPNEMDDYTLASREAGNSGDTLVDSTPWRILPSMNSICD